MIYTLVRFVWYHDTVTRWTLAGYLFLLGTTYLSYSWVVSAAEEGGSSECVVYHPAHRPCRTITHTHVLCIACP